MGQYSDTLFLPETQFDVHRDTTEREREYRERTSGLYETLSNRTGKPFVVHDGPPYPNGPLHMGHLLNRSLKDAALRSRALQGRPVELRPGLDCHGLPVELEARRDLDDESVQAVRRACREHADRHGKRQLEQARRMGLLGDYDRPYRTMDPEYEARQLRALRKLQAAGYLYRGRKPVHWCPHCSTTLANAEVEYETRTTPSVYVRFPARFNGEPVGLVVWTTTPWTLPANAAVGVDPEATYAVVEHGRRSVVQADRVQAVADACDWNATVEQTVAGRELVGTTYDFTVGRTVSGHVVPVDFVEAGGTGLVHLAPRYGPEDWGAREEHGLDAPRSVTPDGTMLAELDDVGGCDRHDKQLVEVLHERGLLMGTRTVEHDAAQCWRCETPLFYRATRQWFFDVEHNSLRTRALQALNDLTFVPEESEKRLRAMLADRPNWCLTRQRDWGVPFPALVCEHCDYQLLDETVLSAVEQAVSAHGSDVWYERSAEHWTSGQSCPECGRSDWAKGTDVMDVWFDSSVSWYAVLDEPPSDLVLEGSDQHRGWFQLSLLTGVALTDEPPFTTMATNGFVTDAEGEALSKSSGGALTDEAVEKWGAEVLRFWALSSDYRSDVTLTDERLREARDFVEDYRNTLSFALGALNDSTVEPVAVENLRAVDRWLLSELSQFSDGLQAHYDDLLFHRASTALRTFVKQRLSAEYVDAVRTRLYCDPEQSHARQSALTTLQHVLRTVPVLSAPLLPVSSGEVWSTLFEGSVHEQTVPDTSWAQPELDEAFEQARRVRSAMMKSVSNEKFERAEAHVSVTCSESSLLTLDNRALREWLGVAAVEAQEGPWAVSVEATTHDKCGRCWAYRADVRGAKQLCERCRSALN